MIESLIRDNEYLIKKIAKKFYNIDYEDLYQAGCLGLIKAYNNYKCEFGLFGSYAYKYIFGEMYELSIKSRDIKINKYYLKLYKLISKGRSILTQKLGREVSLKEISDYINYPIEELNYVSIMMEKNIELDDDNINIEISNKDNLDNKLLINDSLNNLDSLSSLVIKYRYFNDYTECEIASLLGINQTKVSRIIHKSKDKIREYLS